MSVQDPGTLKVVCDDCGAEVDMDTTQYSGGEGLTFGVDDQTITDADWLREGDDTFCPECAAKNALLD